MSKSSALDPKDAYTCFTCGGPIWAGVTHQCSSGAVYNLSMGSYLQDKESKWTA